MKYVDYVMVIISTAVNFKFTEMCNIQVCLTWSVRTDHLNLICKVNNLHHTIVFRDHWQREQGFCVHPNPVPECHGLNKDITVTQNTKTNVTTLTLTGQIDEHVNGEWKCAHGTNVDAAIVNVTVLTNGGPYREPDKTCEEAYLGMGILGTLCGFLMFVVCILCARIKAVRDVITCPHVCRRKQDQDNNADLEEMDNLYE